MLTVAFGMVIAVVVSITITVGDSAGATQAARDPFLWPFASNSPFNVPIGSGAQYEPIRSSRLPGNKFSAVDLKVAADTHAIYKAASTDAFRDVYVNEATCGMPGARFWRRIRFNPNFRPPNFWQKPSCRGGSVDAFMVVFNEDGSEASELYGVPYPLEDPTVVMLAWKIDPKGTGYGPPPNGGLGASEFAGLAGVIRKGETLRAGGIRHALAAYVKGAILAPFQGNAGFVWPATRIDSGWGQYPATGNVHMGTLLAIPPSVDINALGITDSRAREIVRAMQDYGVYVRDTHSEPVGTINITCEFQVIGSSWDWDVSWNGGARTPEYFAVNADVLKGVEQLQVVKNNGPSSIGGGGTPRRPLAPPFGTKGKR